MSYRIFSDSKRPVLTIAQFIDKVAAENPFALHMPEADVRRAAQIYLEEFFESDVPAEWQYGSHDIHGFYRVLVPAYDYDRSDRSYSQFLIDRKPATAENIAEFFSTRDEAALRTERRNNFHSSNAAYCWSQQRAANRI